MQLLAYILIYPILWLVSILPFRLLYTVSDLLYLLMYNIFGYRKQTVIENIKLVFPKKSDLEVKRITKKFYKHFCDMILESIKSMHISRKSMQERFTFKNIDLIKDFEKKIRVLF